MPASTIADRTQRAVPEHENRKPLLGYLRDSRDAFEVEGKDEAAEILDQVIKALEKADIT